MAFFEGISREGFIAIMSQQEKKRMDRFHGEERKRFILRCASNGGMRHHTTRKVKVTLPKMSWEKE